MWAHFQLQFLLCEKPEQQGILGEHFIIAMKCVGLNGLHSSNEISTLLQ